MTLGLEHMARVVGVDSIFTPDPAALATFGLPQRVAMFGQGNATATYGDDPVSVTSLAQAQALWGLGSPLSRMTEFLMPGSSRGIRPLALTAYPLQAAGGAVASTGQIRVTSGVQFSTKVTTVRVTVGGVSTFDLVFAIGMDPLTAAFLLTLLILLQSEMPVTAVFNFLVPGPLLTCKWLGESGNAMPIRVTVLEGEDSGLVFSVPTPMSGGAGNPDVSDALDRIGARWETMIVSGLNPEDGTTLDRINTWGEGRWDDAGQPAVVVTGQPDPSLAASQAITSGRELDRTNVMPVLPGSANAPWDIAAQAVSQMAPIADENPALDYAGTPTGLLIGGLDSEAFSQVQRNQAVASGVSTTRLRGSSFDFADLVTFYHPGAGAEAYRSVVDIVKLSQVIYALRALFESPDWDGAPLLLDSDPTTNPQARKPGTAAAAIGGVLDALGLAAVLTNIRAAKDSISVVPGEVNPKRLNVGLTVQLAGNTDVISTDLNFGF